MNVNPRNKLAILSLDGHIHNRHQGCWGECGLSPCESDRQFIRPGSSESGVRSRLEDRLLARRRENVEAKLLG